MAKTRSQSGNITIKKEEDVKPTLLINGARNTRTSSRIKKRRPSITNNSRLPAQQVKVEENNDTKSLSKSASNSSQLPKGQKISQEQINRLIRYVVSDNMNVNKASRKADMSKSTGLRYYNLYRNDPEKKIPSPQNIYTGPKTMYTQEQIGNLIRYISSDKMSVKDASAKASMNYVTANRYYKIYLKDPDHNIPIPPLRQTYTQDQREAFIGYIIKDKMSVKAASNKAKMNHCTAKDYYQKYFKVQNPDIPTPSHIVTPKCYTQEQIKQVISYIVDDKMSIKAASRKANFCSISAGNYYRHYLTVNNIEAAGSKHHKRYTQEQTSELIGYIVHDKMSIQAASKKSNMHLSTDYKYYNQYINDQKRDA